ARPQDDAPTASATTMPTRHRAKRPPAIPSTDATTVRFAPGHNLSATTTRKTNCPPAIAANPPNLVALLAQPHASGGAAATTAPPITRTIAHTVPNDSNPKRLSLCGDTGARAPR